MRPTGTSKLGYLGQLKALDVKGWDSLPNILQSITLGWVAYAMEMYLFTVLEARSPGLRCHWAPSSWVV